MSYRQRALGQGTESRPVIPRAQAECTGRGLNATEQRACRAYATGHDAFDHGDYAAALTAFNEAYRLGNVPAMLVAIGVSQFKQGQFANATSTWQRYLATGPNATQRQTVESYIANAQQLLNPTPQTFAVAASLPPAVMEPPPNPYARRATIGVWIATGVGALGLLGLGVWLVRRAG